MKQIYSEIGSGGFYYRGDYIKYDSFTESFYGDRTGENFGGSGLYYNWSTNEYMLNGKSTSFDAVFYSHIAPHFSVNIDDPASIQSLLYYIIDGFTVKSMTLYGKNYVVASGLGMMESTIEGNVYSNSDLAYVFGPSGQEGHGAGGSWGDESFFGDAGFAMKALNWVLAGMPVTDGKYIGGTVPLPGIGKIGSYAEMAKLTKGYNGAIQAHHLVEVRQLERLGISAKDAPAVILDRATHQDITNALRTEMPFGKNTVYTTEQMMNGYQRVYTDPTWLSIVKALLGY